MLCFCSASINCWVSFLYLFSYVLPVSELIPPPCALSGLSLCSYPSHILRFFLCLLHTAPRFPWICFVFFCCILQASVLVISFNYADLMYTLLCFTFSYSSPFSFFPCLLIALEGLNTSTALLLFSFPFFPPSPFPPVLWIIELQLPFKSQRPFLVTSSAMASSIWTLVRGASNGGALACICTWLVRCACCT